MSRSFAAHTISGLEEVERYSVSESKNDQGTPLWTTYVLMRISRSLLSDKFNRATKQLEKAAANGSKKASVAVKGFQAVNKALKEDQFFDGL